MKKRLLIILHCTLWKFPFKLKTEKSLRHDLCISLSKNYLSCNVNSLESLAKCQHGDSLPRHFYFHTMPKPAESILINETVQTLRLYRRQRWGGTSFLR